MARPGSRPVFHFTAWVQGNKKGNLDNKQGMNQKRLRVLSIFGTRPEAVKMAPVVRALQSSPAIESLVCVTAQHREMLDQVLELFDIQPDVDLNIMRPNQTLAQLTARIFTELDGVLTNMKPDWILVQGDTTTVMAAALLGYYNKIMVGHVEAGLRTGDKWQPFPEEINRRVAGVAADLHFAPTERNRQALLREGVEDRRIVVTGNTVVDALQWIRTQQLPEDTRRLLEKLDILSGRRELVMITAHRRENFGRPLEEICLALRKLAVAYPERLQLVYPVHLNPNVQEPVHRLLGGVPNITLLPPLDYLPMVSLLQYAKIVLTDSGGIQEEATSLKIPTLVLRNVTERPEGVEAGFLQLVGTGTEAIFSAACRLLDDSGSYEIISLGSNPFGDGHAAEKIVQALLANDLRPGQSA
jgi:UDP-N-acetylglucosamine 2-epimerase (non-hydrolysing)